MTVQGGGVGIGIAEGAIDLNEEGVKPYSDPKADTELNTRIMAEWLATGRICTLNAPGTYYVNESLSFDDSSVLSLGPGVTIEHTTTSESLLSSTAGGIAYGTASGAYSYAAQAPNQIGTIRRPSALTFAFESNFPYAIWRDAQGKVQTSFDPSTLLSPAGKTEYYMDPVSGLDSNSGLTAALPKKTFKTAVNGLIATANTAGVPIIVYCIAGMYDASNSWNGGTRFTVPVTIIGYGGRVIFGLNQNATWTNPDVTYPNTGSTASFTTAARAVDITNLDAFGDYTELTEVATPALCNTTPNSWCQDGSRIYVRRADAAAISNTNTRVYRPSIEGARCSTSAGASTIVANIDFEGGNNGNFLGDGNPTGRCYLINCTAKWAGTNASPVDAIKARDIAFMLNYRCVAAHAGQDGFDYQAASGTTPQWVNIECWGHHNGITGSTSNNGLTGHSGTTGVDISGRYDYNYGGNVAIIDADTQIWQIQSTAAYSLGDVATGGADTPRNYYALGSAALFLDSCIGFGSQWDLFATSSGTISIRNHQSIGGARFGTISEY